MWVGPRQSISKSMNRQVYTNLDTFTFKCQCHFSCPSVKTEDVKKHELQNGQLKTLLLFFFSYISRSLFLNWKYQRKAAPRNV